jgi:hypothetical protein
MTKIIYGDYNQAELRKLYDDNPTLANSISITKLSSKIIKHLLLNVGTGLEEKEMLIGPEEMLEVVYFDEGQLFYTIGRTLPIRSSEVFMLDCSHDWHKDIKTIAVGNVRYIKQLDPNDPRVKGGIHLSLTELQKLLGIETPKPPQPGPGGTTPDPGTQPGQPDPGNPGGTTPDPGNPGGTTPDPGTQPGGETPQPNPGQPGGETPQPGPGTPDPGTQPDPGNPGGTTPDPGTQPGQPDPGNPQQPDPGTGGNPQNPGGTTPQPQDPGSSQGGNETPQNPTIGRVVDAKTIESKPEGYHAVSFKIENGTFLKPDKYYVKHGTSFDSVPVPTAKPRPGYVLVAWDKVFPDKVEEDLEFNEVCQLKNVVKESEVDHRPEGYYKLTIKQGEGVTLPNGDEVYYAKLDATLDIQINPAIAQGYTLAPYYIPATMPATDYEVLIYANKNTQPQPFVPTEDILSPEGPKPDGYHIVSFNTTDAAAGAKKRYYVKNGTPFEKLEVPHPEVKLPYLTDGTYTPAFPLTITEDIEFTLNVTKKAVVAKRLVEGGVPDGYFNYTFKLHESLTAEENADFAYYVAGGTKKGEAPTLNVTPKEGFNLIETKIVPDNEEITTDVEVSYVVLPDVISETAVETKPAGYHRVEIVAGENTTFDTLVYYMKDGTSKTKLPADFNIHAQQDYKIVASTADGEALPETITGDIILKISAYPTIVERTSADKKILGFHRVSYIRQNVADAVPQPESFIFDVYPNTNLGGVVERINAASVIPADYVRIFDKEIGEITEDVIAKFWVYSKTIANSTDEEIRGFVKLTYVADANTEIASHIASKYKIFKGATEEVEFLTKLNELQLVKAEHITVTNSEYVLAEKPFADAVSVAEGVYEIRIVTEKKPGPTKVIEATEGSEKPSEDYVKVTHEASEHVTTLPKNYYALKSVKYDELPITPVAGEPVVENEYAIIKTKFNPELVDGLFVGDTTVSYETFEKVKEYIDGDTVPENYVHVHFECTAADGTVGEINSYRSVIVKKGTPGTMLPTPDVNIPDTHFIPDRSKWGIPESIEAEVTISIPLIEKEIYETNSFIGGGREGFNELELVGDFSDSDYAAHNARTVVYAKKGIPFDDARIEAIIEEKILDFDITDDEIPVREVIAGENGGDWSHKMNFKIFRKIMPYDDDSEFTSMHAKNKFHKLIVQEPAGMTLKLYGYKYAIHEDADMSKFPYSNVTTKHQPEYVKRWIIDVPSKMPDHDVVIEMKYEMHDYIPSTEMSEKPENYLTMTVKGDSTLPDYEEKIYYIKKGALLEDIVEGVKPINIAGDEYVSWASIVPEMTTMDADCVGTLKKAKGLITNYDGVSAIPEGFYKLTFANNTNVSDLFTSGLATHLVHKSMTLGWIRSFITMPVMDNAKYGEVFTSCTFILDQIKMGAADRTIYPRMTYADMIPASYLNKKPEGYIKITLKPNEKFNTAPMNTVGMELYGKIGSEGLKNRQGISLHYDSRFNQLIEKGYDPDSTVDMVVEYIIRPFVTPFTGDEPIGENDYSKYTFVVENGRIASGSAILAVIPAEASQISNHYPTLEANPGYIVSRPEFGDPEKVGDYEYNIKSNIILKPDVIRPGDPLYGVGIPEGYHNVIFNTAEYSSHSLIKYYVKNGVTYDKVGFEDLRPQAGYVLKTVSCSEGPLADSETNVYFTFTLRIKAGNEEVDGVNFKKVKFIVDPADGTIDSGNTEYVIYKDVKLNEIDTSDMSISPAPSKTFSMFPNEFTDEMYDADTKTYTVKGIFITG